MRGISTPVFLASLVAVLVLAGCAGSPVNLDPLSVNGRDGGGPAPSYATLMRIGAAARSGGDLPNAVGVYRRAAEMAPQDPAPLIAAGDVLLTMGAVNEAIVSYNAALVRPGENQGAQLGLAKASEDRQARARRGSAFQSARGKPRGPKIATPSRGHA